MTASTGPEPTGPEPPGPVPTGPETPGPEPTGPESTGPDAALTFTVTDDDTAAALGSGSLTVLGTPRLLAWCEAATCAALEPTLAQGATSVGTRIDLEHLAASPVGQVVQVRAEPAYVDGRLHRFRVSARHLDGRDAEPGRVVATGEITRVVVDAERFLGRLR